MTEEPTYSTLLNSGVQPPGGQPDSLGSLRRLGQYRIVKQLGRGGMGVVYQAEDTHLNRLAALKVMRADHAADSGARARFIREAQAAARLKHDHIVTIYQVGEENDVPFLAMEFLSGKSLEDWLRPDRRATVTEALLISKQVARGLSAAHAANLIHRDIKPANLWLEAPRGRIKILDFGLARYSGTNYPALTQDGSVIGTPAFMAPEQARGDIVDHRCDLFSLGCVMYRMLTGRLPFQGNTLYAVLSAIASETPPSPATLRPETPQPLSDLVDQLLAKKPDDRPALAQAVLEELVAIEQQTRQPQSPQSLLGSQPTSPQRAKAPRAEATWHFPALVSPSAASRSRSLRPWSQVYRRVALALLAAGLAVAGVLALRSAPSSRLESRSHRLADQTARRKPPATAGALSEPADGLASPAGPSRPEGKLYELRLYTTHPGRLPDLHARFRDHTMKLFEKHGMENIIYWTVAEGAEQDGEDKDDMLVYIIAHKDEAAKEASWKAFASDPAWKAAVANSEKNSKILAKPPRAILMRETAFLAVNEPVTVDSDAPPQLWELRRYYGSPQHVASTVERFKSGEKELFNKNGMQTVKFWTATDNSALIYLLAHKDKAAAEASWKGFWSDFRSFMEQYRVSRNVPKGGGDGMESRYLVPTDYSPRK